MVKPEEERERLVQKELNAGNSLRNGVEDNQLHQLTGGRAAGNHYFIAAYCHIDGLDYFSLATFD